MPSPSSSIRLTWPGRSAPVLAPAPALARERDGDPACGLVLGDNLAAMRALAERDARFTLAYLDPPFFTGRQHSRVERERDPETGKVRRTVSPAFDDRWADLGEYLQALHERVAAARALLAPEGCLVLHVDPKTSHYAKVLCDEVFGPGCFASEIVWRYRRWPSKTANFQRVHDVLLRYVRDPETRPRFRQLYEPLAASTRATWGDRKQRAVVVEGRRARSSRSEVATPGTPLGDVWEIGIVAPVARERTGYPTQKPEALLERLVEACTNPGELVLDPYAGSGTTLAVCARLGRRAVGVDESPAAAATTRRRLRALGVTPLEERVVVEERKRTDGRPAVRRAARPIALVG
ncbi:MAG: site-specific DNA-methyltransferase [Sorangiineae bacterium]|nr:site-specific DNA-methyltransferase [Polyangiaceae bacterium]MEB2322340.1 site-specific DNA-methyltransferase [Sorangiineae bacterium]